MQIGSYVRAPVVTRRSHDRRYGQAARSPRPADRREGTAAQTALNAAEAVDQASAGYA